MAETIKEFLVSLGFKVDSPGLNKFKAAINQATKAVTVVGATLGTAKGLLLGFTISTAKTLKGIDSLSKSTGISVKKLQELGYIATTTGGNVEQIGDSLANFNEIMGEANLGLGRGAALFNKFGLSTKKQNGELKTTEQLLREIGEKTKNLSQNEKKTVLSKLGIDGNLINALTGDVGGLREEFNKLYESIGVDTQKAAKNSSEFIKSIERLKFVFDTLKDSIALQFIPELRNGIDSLRRFMVENSKKIVETTVPILKSLSLLAEAFFILSKRIGGLGLEALEHFKKLNKATDGWAGYILAAAIAWRLLVLAFRASPIGRIISFGTALALLLDDFLGYKEGLKSAIDWGSPFVKTFLAIFGIVEVNSKQAIQFKKNWMSVKEWFTTFFSWMTSGFEKLGNAINNTVNALKNKFGVTDVGKDKEARDAFAQSTRRLSSFGSISNPSLLSGSASRNVTQSINQDVNITVQDSGSPVATAKAIYNEQNRVNSDLIRNFAGTVR